MLVSTLTKKHRRCLFILGLNKNDPFTSFNFLFTIKGYILKKNIYEFLIISLEKNIIKHYNNPHSIIQVCYK